MDYDLRALDGVANGQRVRIVVKEWRIVGRLRAFWSMLHDVVASTGATGLTAERLHEVAKLQNGCVDVVLLPNGTPIAIPSSIALDRMTEPEFIAFFQKVEAWLAATYGFVSERAAA
jgi:hypothetical protein